MDFRGKHEREADQAQVDKEHSDYKRMYEQVVADNAALHNKLDQINADREALEQKFADLMDAFSAHRTETQRYLDDMRGINQTIEDMVRDSYQKNQDLMERYRADLSKRLIQARSALPSLDDDS